MNNGLSEINSWKIYSTISINDEIAFRLYVNIFEAAGKLSRNAFKC
jgi:hypothetical protein